MPFEKYTFKLFFLSCSEGKNSQVIKLATDLGVSSASQSQKNNNNKKTIKKKENP